MHRYRLYVPPEKIAGNAARLDGDEFHHAVNVLRRTQGAIAVFDGVSREWDATISDIQKHHATLRLDRLLREEAAPAVRVLACPALTKGTSLDAVIEAATELGAHVIAPVMAARCAASVRKAGAGPRLERWRRITVAAAKQCGRIALPELRPPAALGELLPSLAPATSVVCASGGSARPLLRVLQDEAARASAIAVLVGPEADFTPEEVTAAVEAGAHAASLGPTTLRSPAATAYALAVVSAYLASR